MKYQILGARPGAIRCTICGKPFTGRQIPQPDGRGGGVHPGCAKGGEGHDLKPTE